jgi:hypothetical protein
MAQHAVRELAAILLREHGPAALAFAEVRRSEHSPRSIAYQVWDAIAVALREGPLMSPLRSESPEAQYRSMLHHP